MKWLWLVLAGAVGGLLGGMGLGGGTLLMPILTFALDIPIRLASWLNLVSFLPAATVALIIHVKNGLVSWRDASFLLLFAAVGATVAFLFATRLSETVIRRSFGVLLVLFGSISAFSVLFGFFKKNS